MLTSETEIQMKITNETAGNKHKIEMANEASPKIARKSNFILEVKRHSENAHLPVRGSLGAAGYDLFCSQETVVPAKGKAIVPTDISIKLPPGTYGRVAPRSGLAVKKFLDVGAGVIDGDYRGKVGVVMFNFGNEDFKATVGDRIAQLVIEKIATPDVVEVEDLDETSRGSGGYGSTGLQ